MTVLAEKVDGFRVFCTDEKFARAFADARAILRERRGAVLVDHMDEPKRKRLVMRAELAGMPVVLKHEFFVFRFDRSLKAFLFDSNARNVFRVGTRARERGFSKIPQLFFAAERFSRGILRETISAQEFLTGASPEPPFSQSRKAEIVELMSECHAHGIVSGDVCADNFIATPDGLKLIDFCGGKIFPPLAKARDRIQLERVFGVKMRDGGFAERVFFFQNTLRNLIRRLRGKNTIED